MKTGKAWIEAVAVTCPECGELWCDSRTGSQTLTLDTLPECEAAGWVLTCYNCGEPFKAPALLRKIGA